MCSKKQAMAVYSSLDDEMKLAARRIFLGLCELGEGREERTGEKLTEVELINEKFPAEFD